MYILHHKAAILDRCQLHGYESQEDGTDEEIFAKIHIPGLRLPFEAYNIYEVYF